jgi:hypothetical protein
MPFAVPFRNSLTVSASPDLFLLLQLREMYGSFKVIVAHAEGLQVAEVNLGEVSVQAWAAIAGSRGTAGQFTNGQRSAHPDDLQTQLRLAERVVNRGRSGPLFLAGDVDAMQAVRDLLTPASIDHLMGVIPVPTDTSMHGIAALCLRTLIEFESSQADALTTHVLQEVKHHGSAVAGAEPSLQALRNGSAERLLFASDYRPRPGWICTRGAGSRVQRVYAEQSRGKIAGALGAVNQRVELIRLAGQRRIPIEFTSDDALHDCGGVACVLSDHPEQLAQKMPARYGNVDLVA